jgi:hypothetical protein
MRKFSLIALALLLAPLAAHAQLASANPVLTATLTGYQEVPAVSTDARGTFIATSICSQVALSTIGSRGTISRCRGR